jgi:hypothetical protein
MIFAYCHGLGSVRAVLFCDNNAPRIWASINEGNSMQEFSMKRRNHATLAALKGALLAATLFATPAFAQTATPEGAKQLQNALIKTFGPVAFDKGIVSISPQGSAYAVKVDLNAARGEASKAGVTINVDPLVYMATPNSDGTYAVTTDSPINYSFSTDKDDKPFDMKFNAACKGSGVFDPKISAFSTYDASCPSASMVAHSPEQDIEANFGSINSKVTGQAAGSGGTTIGLSGTLNDFVEKITIKDKDTPVEVTIHAKSGTQDISVDSAQLTSILGIVSLAANAANPKDLIPQQDAIKQKVLAALPLWNNMSGKASLNDVSVDTPIGTVKLGSFEESIGLTGAIKDANYSIAIKYAGLELPQGPIPAWVAPLVPNQGNIDLKFSGVDLDGLARLAIQNFDATKDPPIPDSLTGQFLAMVMAGQPHVTLSPSTLTASSGAVSAEGTMSVFPSQQGKMTISATNLDQIIAAVNAAEVPDKQQTMMGVALVKGLAKTGPDGKAVWDVVFDAATKAISVNGQVLSAGGGDQ